MKSFHGAVRVSLLTITGTVAVASLSYGAQPPNVVTSDAMGDTAMGTNALKALYGSAFDNTAAGSFALAANTTGFFNTAIGSGALALNTEGSHNTASGGSALISNTTGSSNTASGSFVLFNNTTGSANTASGDGVLYSNTTGSGNTASGLQALQSNTSGSSNVAYGLDALFYSTTGSDNTAVGRDAMLGNIAGSSNTAIGAAALNSNQGGSNNIAIGSNAGYYIRGSRYNIDIGNVGNQADVGLIRLGTSGQQTAAYVAGIATAHVTGSAVYITSNGQLGVLASSERYKTDVASMGSSTEKLRELRPVTFHLKNDRKGDVQYGLIAEEVAKVYPELVIRNGAGRIEGVRYEELTPMLLNEVQRQQTELQELRQQLAELQEFRRSMQSRAADQ
jgi:hypothetical protein